LDHFERASLNKTESATLELKDFKVYKLQVWFTHPFDKRGFMANELMTRLLVIKLDFRKVCQSMVYGISAQELVESAV
jgi:hypothetical protein